MVFGGLPPKEEIKSLGALQEKLDFCRILFAGIGLPQEHTALAFNLALKQLGQRAALIVLCQGIEDISPREMSTLLRQHQDHPKAISLVRDHDPFLLPGPARFWAAAPLSTWERVGGLCPWLRHPRNLTSDLRQRILHQRLPLIQRPELFRSLSQSTLHDPWSDEALAFDARHYQRIHPFQNYLKGKAPDFVVVGALKAGSTSLMHMLSSHPKVHAPRVVFENVRMNEMHFFDTDRFEKYGVPWYRSLFHHPERPCAGEKTPEYMLTSLCHQRLAQVAPDAKLIVSLRNPVDRAWSAIMHLRREPQQNWGLAAMKEGSAREAFDRLVFEHIDDEIVQRGLYFQQLSGLLEHFPREQLLVVIQERMDQDHQGVMDRVFAHLGLQSVPVPQERQMKGAHEDQRSTKALEKLRAHYRKPNQQLFELLGEEIPEWALRFAFGRRCSS